MSLDSYGIKQGTIIHLEELAPVRKESQAVEENKASDVSYDHLQTDIRMTPPQNLYKPSYFYKIGIMSQGQGQKLEALNESFIVADQLIQVIQN